MALVFTLRLRGQFEFAGMNPLLPTRIHLWPIRTIALAWLFAIGACHVARGPAQSGPSSPVSVPPPEVEVAAKEISAELLRGQITQISSDAFAGRGPATAGDRAARAYLVTQLTSLGLEPGLGRQGWEQPVDLVSVTTAMPKVWTFERGDNHLSLSWWDQYIAGSGVQMTTGAIDRAEVVFVGYGIEAPEYGWDDFKGSDVKGKVLLMLNNDPDWDPALFGGTTRLYYGRWTYKFESAARHAAAGAIIIHTTPSAGYPFQVVRSSWGGTRFELPSKGAPALTVQGWVTEDGARALVQLAGQDLAKLVESARSKAFDRIPEQTRARSDGQRVRSHQRERSWARRPIRHRQRPPRPPRCRQAGREGRRHL